MPPRPKWSKAWKLSRSNTDDRKAWHRLTVVLAFIDIARKPLPPQGGAAFSMGPAQVKVRIAARKVVAIWSI